MKPFLFLACACLFLNLAGCKKRSDGTAPSGAAASQPQAAGHPDDPANLKLKWPAGARLSHRMELEQKMNLPAPGGGGGMKQDVNMGQDFALAVLSENSAGGHEVELEFQAVNMSVSMGGNEVLNFDTRGEATGDEGNPAARPFRLMVGQKLVYHLDQSNRVERVDGAKELIEKVSGATSGSRNPMAAMFNEQYFKQMMDGGGDFPAEPVKPGATWPSRREISMGPLGEAVLDLKYTFTRWEQHDNRRCALLEFTGPLTGKSGATNGPLAGVVTFTGGRTAGKAWVDPARGFITDNQIQQSIEIRFKMPGAPADAPPADTTMEQRISVKVVEVSGQ